MFSKELEAFASLEKYYTAGGVRTRCFEAGKGSPVILLHGGGGHAEAWVRNVIPLSEHFHVFAIDYLGHGYTDLPKGMSRNLDDFCKHLLNFMDAAGIQKANLIGESMGGQISVLMAHEHPERVDKLGLIVGGIPSQEHGYIAGITQFQELTREASKNPTLETIRKRMEWLFHDPKTLPDELVAIRLKIYTRPKEEPEGGGLGSGGRRSYGLIEKIPKLKAPILFFWTTHNPTCPWHVAEKVHQTVPGSRFVLVDNAAHWPQFELPEEFNRILTEFLSDQPDEVLIDTYRRRFW